jgi:hypothetical protein
MEWAKLKKGYTKIPSSQDQKEYCWTKSCINDNYDDRQTLENLKDTQSSLFIEAKLYPNDTAQEPIAQITKIYDLPKDKGSSGQVTPSEVPDIFDGNIQTPEITIKKVQLQTDNELVVDIECGVLNQTAFVSVNEDETKAPLENGLVVTIAAYLASSKLNGTRK